MKKALEYERRLNKHYDELKWLYCELYNNDRGYEITLGLLDRLCEQRESWYRERNSKWKALDREREKNPGRKEKVMAATQYRITGRCRRNWVPWKSWQSFQKSAMHRESAFALTLS